MNGVVVVIELPTEKRGRFRKLETVERKKGEYGSRSQAVDLWGHRGTNGHFLRRDNFSQVVPKECK